MEEEPLRLGEPFVKTGSAVPDEEPLRLGEPLTESGGAVPDVDFKFVFHGEPHPSRTEFERFKTTLLADDLLAPRPVERPLADLSVLLNMTYTVVSDAETAATQVAGLA